MTFISGFSFLKYVAPKIEKEDTNNDINRETTAPTLPNEALLSEINFTKKEHSEQ